MTVLYHPEFPSDIRRFAVRYADLSSKLETRFRYEVDAAIARVIAKPVGGRAISFYTGSVILREVRRHNLAIFPFFVLYGLADDRLVFGSLIPSAPDPLTWLDRFA
ncbi:MAG: hypothetical protein WDM96_16305 [Lacunisphaera sp.]